MTGRIVWSVFFFEAGTDEPRQFYLFDHETIETAMVEVLNVLNERWPEPEPEDCTFPGGLPYQIVGLGQDRVSQITAATLEWGGATNALQ